MDERQAKDMLATVDITAELAGRPLRPTPTPRAILPLDRFARQMVQDPDAVLTQIVEHGRLQTGGGTAGLSVFEPGPDEGGNDLLRWRHVTGQGAARMGHIVPSAHSASSLALRTGRPLLLSRPERIFGYPPMALPLTEVLMVPLLLDEGQPFGTLWSIHHGPGPHFDAADAEALAALATPASLGLRLARDRDRRDATEEALRISQARYRALFDNIDAGFCVIQLTFDAADRPLDYRFIEVNPAFVAQTGLEDAAGRWMRDLAPDHEQNWFDRYGAVAMSGEPIRFELPAAALGRWYDVYAYRVDAPELHHVAVLFNDITERKRQEDTLRELNATLESRVEERTGALLAAEEQLRQSQKMEAIGQLTGGVAHDFNNLLTVIRSSADLLRRQNLPEDRRRRYIDAIADTADRAAKLTGQLLAFSRRQALTPAVFDAAERVQGIAEMLRSVLGSRVTLEIETHGEGGPVETDPVQFETAVVNLAVNARDAMGGEGRLRILVEAVDRLPSIRGHAAAHSDFVAISVADTGCGIPPENLSRIFEPFFTTKEVGKGTGLGLSQVFGFSKQSGGEIDVASTPGHGTVFTLYLPRSAAPGQPALPLRGPRPETRRGRILVVEDNVAVGEFAEQLLRDLGYDPVLATGAAAALERVERAPGSFDAVLTDVVMPGTSGIDLARTLRQHWPSLPVVLTSGYSHVLAEEPRHGFPLLRKPYSVEELSEILSAAMR